MKVVHQTEKSAHRLIRNILFSGLRLAANTGTAIFTSAVIARTLGPEQMGRYSYVIWLVGALSIFANVGLPSAITKYMSELVGSGQSPTAVAIGNRLLRIQLAVTLLISLATAIFAFFSTTQRTMIILAAIMLSAQALQQGLGAALAGLQEFKRIAALGLWMGLTQVTCVGVAALIHAGVVGMLWATLIGLWGGVLLHYRAVHSSFSRLTVGVETVLAPSADVLSRIRKFVFTGSYILLLDAIVWQRSEVLFLKWYSLVAQISFYTIAYSLASKLNDLTSILSNVMLPRYSESFGRSGLEELREVFATDVKYIQMMMVPVCLVGVALAKPVVQLIYGTDYLPMVVPLRVLIASTALTSLGVVAASLVVGTDKQSFIAKYGTVVAILNITLDLSLIPKHGALGASVANCSAQIVGVIGGIVYVLRYAKAGFPWRTTATIYCAALIAMAPLAYFSNWVRPELGSLAVSIIFGVVLYVGILAMSGELSMAAISTVRQALFGKTHVVESP
jgi:O-antigen/teichoic acid export membrane protein